MAGATARYFGVTLGEYWRRDGMSFDELLARHAARFDTTLRESREYDDSMVREWTGAAGDDFAAIGALSFRQVLGANSLVWFNGSGLPRPAPAGPMLLVKGIGSSGDTGTIDDTYPAARPVVT